MAKSKNEYKFYACLKDGSNSGLICDGRQSAEEAESDLRVILRNYLTNHIIFIGIVKCKDGKPLDHIKNLNE
nr:MAG TPA: hypothetical protein [Caudoviricetes sp.]